MLKSIVAGLVIGGGIFAGADYALSIPNVMVSYETNSCVQVENFESVLFGTTNYNCENMPEKFNHIWVK